MLTAITHAQMLQWLCTFGHTARARGNGWASTFAPARLPLFDRMTK